MEEEPNIDNEESGEPTIQMRNVKTRENKTIDVGDGLVEDYSSKSSLLSPFYSVKSQDHLLASLACESLRLLRLSASVDSLHIKNLNQNFCSVI